jgi:hypothetical protein
MPIPKMAPMANGSTHPLPLGGSVVDAPGTTVRLIVSVSVVLMVIVPVRVAPGVAVSVAVAAAVGVLV